MTPLGTVPLAYASLPRRALTAFDRYDVQTVGQIDAMSDDELMRIPGIGKISILDIRCAVDEIRSEIHAGRFSWYDAYPPIT